MRKHLAVLSLTTAVLSMPGFASTNPDGRSLFTSKCAMCHGIGQKKLGPAVKSMSPDPKVLRITIAKGRNAMPGYAGKLKSAEIDALVDYLLANQ